jgi:hypothetical protein
MHHTYTYATCVNFYGETFIYSVFTKVTEEDVYAYTHMCYYEHYNDMYHTSYYKNLTIRYSMFHFTDLGTHEKTLF